MSSDLPALQVGPASLEQTPEASSSSVNSWQTEKPSLKASSQREETAQSREVWHIAMEGSGAGEENETLSPWACMGIEHKIELFQERS